VIAPLIFAQGKHHDRFHQQEVFWPVNVGQMGGNPACEHILIQRQLLDLPPLVWLM